MFKIKIDLLLIIALINFNSFGMATGVADYVANSNSHAPDALPSTPGAHDVGGVVPGTPIPATDVIDSTKVAQQAVVVQNQIEDLENAISDTPTVSTVRSVSEDSLLVHPADAYSVMTKIRPLSSEFLTQPSVKDIPAISSADAKVAERIVSSGVSAADVKMVEQAIKPSVSDVPSAADVKAAEYVVKSSGISEKDIPIVGLTEAAGELIRKSTAWDNGLEHEVIFRVKGASIEEVLPGEKDLHDGLLSLNKINKDALEKVGSKIDSLRKKNLIDLNEKDMHDIATSIRTQHNNIYNKYLNELASRYTAQDIVKLSNKDINAIFNNLEYSMQNDLKQVDEKAINNILKKHAPRNSIDENMITSRELKKATGFAEKFKLFIENIKKALWRK